MSSFFPDEKRPGKWLRLVRMNIDVTREYCSELGCTRQSLKRKAILRWCDLNHTRTYKIPLEKRFSCLTVMIEEM